MTKSEWIEIRDGLERCLRIVNTSPAKLGVGGFSSEQSELRADLRKRLTRLLFSIEGIIDGREDYDRH